MRRVEKVAIHAALGDGVWCDGEPVHGRNAAAEARDDCEFDLDFQAAFTHLYCSRTDWNDVYMQLDTAGLTDHHCRITRQRANVSASDLPLPPSPYAFLTTPPERMLKQRTYGVPARSLQRLWREALSGARAGRRARAYRTLAVHSPPGAPALCALSPSVPPTRAGPARRPPHRLSESGHRYGVVALRAAAHAPPRRARRLDAGDRD